MYILDPSNGGLDEPGHTLLYVSPPLSLSTTEEARAREALDFQDQNILAAIMQNILATIIQRPDDGQEAGSEAGAPPAGTDAEADEMGCWLENAIGDSYNDDSSGYSQLDPSLSPRDGGMQQVAAGSVQPGPLQIHRWSRDILLEAVTGVLGRNCTLSAF